MSEELISRSAALTAIFNLCMHLQAPARRKHPSSIRRSVGGDWAFACCRCYAGGALRNLRIREAKY